jgi:SAM-dependent methyltransferase
MKGLFGKLLGKTDKQKPFSLDPKTGLMTRQYNNYEEYLAHQRGKLERIIEKLRAGDLEYEQVVYERYAGRQVKWQGKSVICLAARLGGEVRAFKRLGALAIGIDIEPGPENHHVLYGDFNAIQFPDGCFDIAFTNAVDHVLDLEHFLYEIRRVLAPGGMFFVELAEVRPATYEVIDTSNVVPIIRKISEVFEVISEEPLANQTSYAAWDGKLLCLQHRLNV